MKKILTKTLLAVLILCLSSACSDKSSAPVLPQYSAESKDTFSEESSSPSEAENENGFYPQESEQPVESPNSDSSFTGFTGIKDLSETPRIGNTQQNLTSCPAYCGIVCNDGESGVYYTALGYDNFLHRKKDGEDVVFLEKTVWGINIIGGHMYCIMNSAKPVQNLPPYSHGDIYRVDLKTGEMSLVLATRAKGLAAFENKLCFIYDNGMNDTFYNRVYEYELDNGGITPRDGAFLGFVGGYYVGFDEFGQNSCLINASTGEKLRYTGGNNVYNFTVDGGYCYYQVGGSCLYRLDPENGEEIPMMPDGEYNSITIQYSESEHEIITADGLFIAGHCIVEGSAYLVFDRVAFRVSPDGATEIFLTPINDKGGWFYVGLFTDGEMLYSVKNNMSEGRYILVGLQFTDEEAAQGVKTVKEIDLL